MSQAFRKEVRAAIKTVLEADPTLNALFPSSQVVFRYRPTRLAVALPEITMFDSGEKADTVVPLYDRDYQLDVWTNSDLDLAEDIGDRIVHLLDHQPLPVNSTVCQVAYLSLIRDSDATQEDTDLVRKTLVFRMLVYQLN